MVDWGRHLSHRVVDRQGGSEGSTVGLLGQGCVAECAGGCRSSWRAMGRGGRAHCARQMSSIPAGLLIASAAVLAAELSEAFQSTRQRQSACRRAAGWFPIDRFCFPFPQKRSAASPGLPVERPIPSAQLSRPRLRARLQRRPPMDWCGMMCSSSLARCSAPAVPWQQRVCWLVGDGGLRIEHASNLSQSVARAP